MKSPQHNVLTGFIGLYIMVACIVFVPYYNWNYAKTHGFVKWILLGELVATAKAAVWPYYVLSARTPSRWDSPDDNHFRNSKRAFDEALMIVDEVGDVSRLPSDLKAEFADLLRVAIAQANLVQPSYLREAHPDYPAMYEKKYKHGMSLMLQGIENENVASILAGAYECNEFADWIHVHKSEFSI